VEQAGTMGKRRAVPGHDRSPLDPLRFKNCGFEMRNFGLNSRQAYASTRCHSYHNLQSAAPRLRRRIGAQDMLNVERAEGFLSVMPAQKTPRTPNESRQLVLVQAAPIVPHESYVRQRIRR
jgi:hypothetical protein